MILQKSATQKIFISGFLEPGNELYSDVQYNASSTWGDSHLALKAMKGDKVELVPTFQ